MSTNDTAQDVTVRYALVTAEYPANTDTEPDLVRDLEYAASHVFDHAVEVHPGDVVAPEHAPTAMDGVASTESTWTFFGYWGDDDTIVVEYAEPGEEDDTRVDTGEWAGGLWAASASGVTMEAAQAAAVAEYETPASEGARGPLMTLRLPEDLDGDSLVVLPDGMDVPGAQHDDGVSAVALIDLARYIVTEYGDTDETTPANFSALLSDYDAWRDERADLSATEEHGGPGGDAWADSDDTGCDLASRLADALRTTTGVAASLRAALNVALNSPDDSDAMEGARAALDGLTASDLAATADARYAALLARVTPAPVVTTANEDRPTYGDCVPGDPIARAVEAFSGEPVALMLAVADRHGIAVHWQDRQTMEAHHGLPFPDDVWARVREHMDGYDEWLENSGARESIAYWQDRALEHAGLTTDDDTERTVYTCRTCGRTVTLITDEDGTYWMHDDDELIMCDSTAWKGSPPPGALTAPHQSQVTT